MKFSIVPLFSFAACASAAAQSSETLNSVSVLEVLATALPQSLVNLAITNPAAASSVISSEFAHSETPAWYSKLPKPIQTYLVPVTTISQAPSAIVSGLPSELTSLATLSFSAIPKPKPMNATMNMTTTRHSSSKSSSKKTSTTHKLTMTTAKPTHSTPTGGASLPTAIYGAGIAGIVGIVGLMAL